MRVYLDSTPVIVLVEHSNAIPPTLLQLVQDPSVLLYSSDLTLMETLIHPIRKKNMAMRIEFENFFSKSIDPANQLFRNDI